MRTLNERELDNVSGGCFNLFGNLLGGLFGGAQTANTTSAATPVVTPTANTTGSNNSLIPAVNSQVQALSQGLGSFLQNPLGGIASLVETGVRDAVSLFTRLF